MTMKKYVIITIAFMMLTQLSFSQDTLNHQRQQRDRLQKKEHLSDDKRPSNHGKEVSTVAQETVSGKGKGEIVSSVAKEQGQNKKDLKKKGQNETNNSATHRNNINNSARNQHMNRAGTTIPGNKGLGRK